MAKTPLNLDLPSLLSAAGDAPLPELEVVPATAAADGDAAVAEISDHDIKERMKRLMHNIKTGFADRLPDKGVKLRQSLNNLQYETDRRKLARFRKEDEERLSRSFEVSKSPEVSVFQDVPSPKCTNLVPRKQSSFFSLFSKKAGWTASQETCGSLKDDREQKHGGHHLNRAKPTKLPSRQCASSIGSRSTYKLSSGDLKNIWSSEISSSHAGKSFLSHSPKKKRVLACSGSMHQQPKKEDEERLSRSFEVSKSPEVSESFDPFFGPSHSINQLLNKMDQLGQLGDSQFVASRVPPTWRSSLVREDKDALYIKVDMPGLGKENVRVTVEQNTLVLKGEGEKESDEESGRRYSTRIDLPSELLKLDQIKAEMKNGVLKVVVPKVKEEDRKDVFQVSVE